MYISAKSNPKEQREFRRSLRNNLTPSEAILWNILKNGQVGGYKFRRQHGMGPYVLDFYCPSLKLCVELDGDVHNSEQAFNHDEERTAFLNENGITVIRFENYIVRTDARAIINAILDSFEKGGEKLHRRLIKRWLFNNRQGSYTDS